MAVAVHETMSHREASVRVNPLAGAVNALAGGGTLITFPVLLALGIPAVAANITNTVALCPGYLGGALAQFKDLSGEERALYVFGITGALGGLVGGVLLLNTGEESSHDADCAGGVKVGH